MILDAPSFELVLTPEAALGIVQKELSHRGWKKYEVEEIRLIYVPFYAFSFDVRAEGAPPISGKAALNAYSGDLSDFIPMLLERPLKKTKNMEEGAEVEESAISMVEAKEASKDKLAAQTGIKREMVAVSAFTKIYVPFFRIWLEVAHDSFKLEVDALMGAPLGMENIPSKPKTWNEATSETLDKLKSPSGWVELTGKAISALTGGGGGKGEHGGAEHGAGEHGGGGAGGAGSVLQSTGGKQIILIAVIGILVYLLFIAPQSSGVKCTGELGNYKNGCILRGTCSFAEKTPVGKGISIFIKDGGQELYESTENVFYYDSVSVPYNITFKPSARECSQYGWGSRII